jgi:hypothetical protein
MDGLAIKSEGFGISNQLLLQPPERLITQVVGAMTRKCRKLDKDPSGWLGDQTNRGLPSNSRLPCLANQGRG